MADIRENANYIISSPPVFGRLPNANTYVFWGFYRRKTPLAGSFRFRGHTQGVGTAAASSMHRQHCPKSEGTAETWLCVMHQTFQSSCARKTAKVIFCCHVRKAIHSSHRSRRRIIPVERF